tara:strand:- start:176 stop:730 length:555 start_codon:yes stop_codon:yes gene_type:complete
MPNKFHRQNFRMGTNPFSRKSNIQKIAEVFGPKKTKVKKDKKLKKRMMANKGGGADTGTMGEIKSKLGVLTDKMKKIKMPGRLTDEDREKLIRVFDKETNKNIFINKNKLMKNLDRYNPATDTERLSEGDIKRAKKLINMKKGGLAKKKKKFPDISGDGKVTMKDVLMARGVIPKNKKDKKKVI